MFKLTTLAILLASGAFLLPVALAAEEASPADSAKANTEAADMNTPAKQRLTITTLRDKTVLAATENKPSQDTFPVMDSDGNVYYNHIVKIDDLPEVEKDIDVVDTYTFVHDGVTYTNKIVE